jgi:hypothetical protein
MIRKLTLLICLLPNLLLAERASDNPLMNSAVLSGCDSISEEPPAASIVPVVQQGIEKIEPVPDNNDEQKNAKDDWKKNGLFQALFHVGINFAQIDGDAYAGYNKVGFDGGAGVLVRFHKYLSTSIEANYTMWGARYSFSDKNDLYNANLNYVQIPIALNVHEKEIFMFSAGLNLGFLTQYEERNEKGIIITDTVQPQPKRFDLDAFAALHFIIKKQFGIGLKFSYSMLPFRGLEPQYATLTHIHGEYNNVLTFRFVYILSAWKKK